MKFTFTTQRCTTPFMALLLCLLSLNLQAQTAPCYSPMSGFSVAAREVSGGVLCINCTSVTDINNVTDGNPDNFASFAPINVIAGAGMDVYDSVKTYPAGWHAGYVVSFGNTVLNASVLGSIEITTYNDGVLRETKTSSTGLSVTLLGNNSGRTYLSFPTTQSFDEVRIVFTTVGGVLNAFDVYYAMAFDPQCGLSDNNTVCYDQIAGPSTEIGYNGGVANALVSLTNEDNITNGNRNAYATLTLPAGVSLLTTPPYVSVLEKEIVHPAGNRAGFMIGYNPSLLSADVLNTLAVQTYLHGQLQETADFTGGNGLLTAKALATNDTNQRELSFTTTMPFNEVRLVVAQSATVNVGSIRIYYAFESDGNCAGTRTQLLSSQTAPNDGSINAARTGTQGGILCLGQSLTNTANVVNSTTTDYATYHAATVSLAGCGAAISVKNSGTDYPAGTFAGFAISKQGGLLDLTLLDAVTVNVYQNGGTTPVASMTGSALLNLGLLNGEGGLSYIGFKPGVPFDEIQIEFNSGLLGLNLGSTFRIYYAYVIIDSDNDGVPDVVDICTGNDALDSDGDGTPDDCDACSAVNGKSVYRDTDGDGVIDACDADSDDDGIADAVEDRSNDGNPVNDDADGDGIPNYLDLDSDNDGLADIRESGVPASTVAWFDADNNGVIDMAIVRSNNGLADTIETSDNDNAGNTYTLSDKDGDGAPDYIDLDTDNDGINDIIEGHTTMFADANGDGMLDGDDTDRDGILNVADGNSVRGANSLGTSPDTDGDGVPNYQDLDSDNDLISDLVESGETGYVDNDHNGIADGGDVDGDGISDGLDGNNGAFGDGNQGLPKDTDNDGIPDYIDTDSNGDGTNDIVDNGNGWQDLDGDGGVDNPTDPDDDGIPNNHGDDLDPNDFGGLGSSTLVNIKVFLEGALASATDTLMRDDLRQQGLIPLSTPYNASLNARFTQYGGGGDEMTLSTVLNANAGTGDAVVDWVLLEFRSASNAATIVKTLNAFVQRDGDIVGADGNKLGAILDAGTYYLSIKHRNHLGVMTAAASVSSGSLFSIDFTMASTPVYGTNATHLLSSGKKALYGGDANMDGQVYATAPGNDKDALQVILSGDPVGFLNTYNSGDLNMDAQTYISAPGNDRDWLLMMPLGGNTLGYADEQLP